MNSSMSGTKKSLTLWQITILRSEVDSSPCAVSLTGVYLVPHSPAFWATAMAQRRKQQVPRPWRGLPAGSYPTGMPWSWVTQMGRPWAAPRQQVDLIQLPQFIFNVKSCRWNILHLQASHFIHLVLQEKIIEHLVTLAGVAHWIELRPANWNITGLIPVLGTCLGCGPGPQLEACKRQPIDISLTHQCFSFSFTPSLKWIKS